MKMSECLDKAANWLEKHSWVQGSFSVPALYRQPRTEKACLMGACENVCPDTPRWRFAEGLGFRDSGYLYKFNDAPKQRKKHVVARLREYAEINR